MRRSIGSIWQNVSKREIKDEEMKLVIGGRAQGKLNYVLQHMTDENYQIYDGVFPDGEELFNLTKKNEWLIVNHFHNWVNKELKENRNPEEELEAFLKKGVRFVIISDEIGNGIVPVDAFERDYRERTGRMLITLASQADEVVRVICGIGQKIK